VTGTLFVVATPIGNLDDITMRAIETLKRAALIAAEDTRVTRRLLDRFSINTPCISLREQNADRVVPVILEHLHAGRDVAVVSDAGTPAISDPGVQIVDAAHDAQIAVCPIPGPSALCSAVSVAALKGDGIRFFGFLPRSGKERERRLSGIAQDPACCVIYESPHRLRDTLSDLLAACGSRRAVVARELTKVHEEVRRGDLRDLLAHFAVEPKGEITILIEGKETASAECLSDEALGLLIADRLANGASAKDIAASLSGALGLSKKKIYDLTVSLIARQR